VRLQVCLEGGPQRGAEGGVVHFRTVPLAPA
jgi:hypothetical protein